MRWTRVCFCGQATPFGRLAGFAVFGRSYLTGSEEGRGPLFDATGEVLEGQRLAAPVEPQGIKIPALTDSDRTLEPIAVPLSAARIGNRVMLTVPGEMTVELGRRVRASARAALSGSELRHVVVAGYANEYVSYLTTPEEYAAQHYEGGTTVYGPASGPFLTAALADLAGRLGSGAPPPPAYPFDPTRGLRPDGPGYPAGAPAGRITRQPRAAARLRRAELRWRGGADGLDRPLDRAFVTVQRLGPGGWTSVDDDRGLRILWRVDDDRPAGARDPRAPLGAPRHATGPGGRRRSELRPGRYRFVVSATRYRLVSRSFRVLPSRALRVTARRGAGGGVQLVLRYPAPVPERDLTARPRRASGGAIRVLVGGRPRTLRIPGSGRVSIRGSGLTVERGAARDAYGNTNARTLRVP